MEVTMFPVCLLFACISICFGECPPSRSIQPCTCESGEEEFSTYRGIMRCPGIVSDEQLEVILNEARNYDVKELIFTLSELRFFPYDGFRGSQFEHIHIANSTLYALSDTDIAFEGLEEKLQLLTVANSQFLNSWDWNSLRNMKNLLDLKIINCDMVYIPDSFKNLPKTLEKIVITGNPLDSIAEGAFASFEILKNISLRGNRLKTVARSIFPNPAPEFKELDLSYNELTSFPKGMFSEMPSLETLDLSGNPIITLDEESFQIIWGKLKLFNMKDTGLRCDCRLMWISKSSTHPKVDNSECQHPDNLKGKSLSSLKTKDLLCWYLK